jgi:glycosyltransferase involved in cell wall biosynthesis
MKVSAGKKHIVFLVENGSVPNDMRVWKEARVARDMGFDVTVVSPRGARVDRERRAMIEGIEVYRYPHVVLGGGFGSYFVEYLLALLMTAWIVIGISFRRRIDAFHVANPPDVFFLVTAPFKLFGTRYIFDVHDLFVNTFESKYEHNKSPFKSLIVQVIHVVERINIACADIVVVTNRSYHDYIQQRYHVPEARLFVVRNAPPLDSRLEIVADSTLRRGRKYMMVFFGNMGEDDGVDVILRACHHLVHTEGFSDFICYLIGPTEVASSPAINSLRALHRELGIEGHVEFTGYLSWQDIHKYLNTADVALSPDTFTQQNNLSTMIKIMEYMSHGLPIVSFDLKENRYSAGEAAVYSNGYDWIDFAESVRQLLLNESQRQAMREIGLNRYRSSFNWNPSAEVLRRVYGTLNEDRR